LKYDTKFTYPFRYIPSKEVKSAASELIQKIDTDPALEALFKEGKMLGVLIGIDKDNGQEVRLNAFSGLAGGKSIVDGFVPPIFDTTTLPILREKAQSPKQSAELQDFLFDNYITSNYLGKRLSIKDIFARRGLVPPGGTGECAGAKLLNYAYLIGLKPISMGEFWYGKSPSSGEVREHGRFYPACTGKCGPLLSFMMEGLDVEDNPLQRLPNVKGVSVIFEDDHIIVAEKPSGMLCAPGLTGNTSLIEYLEKEHGHLYSCHRLDMDTSGVMIFAKTIEAQRNIQSQFATHQVNKTYLAHLVAGSRPWRGKLRGTIALPLSPDYYDRPRQIVDKQNGKLAITEYEILEIFPDGEMDVRFTPKTGRTHQLRVHAASPLGMGRPIKGDALYGSPSHERLMLHAQTLTLMHPVSSKVITFNSTESLPSNG